jgi:hypothetical protein
MEVSDSKELSDLHSTPNTARTLKAGKLQLAEYMGRMKKYQIPIEFWWEI